MVDDDNTLMGLSEVQNDNGCRLSDKRYDIYAVARPDVKLCRSPHRRHRCLSVDTRTSADEVVT